ncbi:Sporulation-specific protein, putative [Perkinsus marinus ATCC 50983]|uniref:Sporulation-specific protein, putative n=1 Tax=Perkinsus marinus (strain ATCC 50983 / TXsc) TaxID=423536 RepID=C5LXA9_PERM5|nr:Sporulation-specific protein, putative [Perkinsus marinus ATCC 50983]EEQ98658.1 Sporulation-specific protein, putative [Perkinsus marinus ATCC 50983]|eukprot:XP_002765941.1 Sporulation-specific protein, putative [Perkinsus marinus ATCC 50983]
MPNTVADVSIALEIDEIEKAVGKRASVVSKLEHAYNVLKYKGVRPKHKVKICGKEKVDSIDFYENQLEEYNTQISAFITKAVEYQEKAHDDSMDDDDDDDDTKKKNKLAFVTALPSRIVHGVLGKDDINTRSGAFITFNNLKSSMAARQMVHYKIPFIMSTVPAPAVKDVYWSNVGISHYRQQLGVLLSIVLTICLCIFWTIPVAFVASISEVDNLKREFSFINDASNAWPGLDLLLKQISPILLAVLNALLPIFLMVFSKQEGHISSATLDASLFAKLALFFIIQTFFVSAIAGSLFTSLQQLVDNPAGTIRDILATNLPQQANFFIAFVFVEVGLGLGLELIRLVPYIISVIRSLFGPNLTAKERSSTWLGLRPLSVPVTLDQPKLLSDVMLFFMILFVYSILSPIVSLVMLFAFLSMNVIYKHQYAHVYDPSNDTGGQMWTRAMRYILFCLIIAEFTIIAVIGIKEGKIVAPLMAPLFIMTILFWVYLEQQHFTVAQYLPSYTAANIDNIYNEYNDDRITTSSWKGAYMQEALKVPLLQPNTDQSDDDEEEEDDYDDRPVAGLDEVIVDTRKESKLSTPRTEDIP